MSRVGYQPRLLTPPGSLWQTGVSLLARLLLDPRIVGIQCHDVHQQRNHVQRHLVTKTNFVRYEASSESESSVEQEWVPGWQNPAS